MTVIARLLHRGLLEDPRVPITGAALADWLNGQKVHSGVTVNEKTSLSLIAVYRCVELIAGTCAALPLKAYKLGTRERAPAPVLDDPHPELTSFEVWEIIYASLLLWGNAYAWKGYDGTGRVRRLWPINPARVGVDLVDPPPDDPDEFNAGSKVFVIADSKGRRQPYTRREILHIPGLGYDGRVGLSRIKLAKQGIGLGLAAEEYAARFFGSGSLLSGILSTDKVLDEPQAERLKARWKERVGGLAKAHDIAVLDSGAKFEPVSIPPEDAELLATRHFTTSEIARLFGLPPHAVGDVEKSTSWGTGIEQQTIGMVQFTLQPSYLTRVEKRITKEVLLNPQVYAEYVVEGLLRGDAKTRAAFYTAMRQIEAMSANEVRARENLEPYEGGDDFKNPNINPKAAVAADGGDDADKDE